MSSNAERLAAAVKARREELDVTQLDVWQSGGPSNTTLTIVENAQTETLTRTTARKLDKGLRWEAGSARRIWDGTGEGLPLTTGTSTEELLAEVDGSDLSEETRALIRRTLLEDQARRERGAG